MTENQGRHKPVTLEDIAKLAGVHSRTVADAIKGTGRVAAATREKVLQIAKELNYVPNAAARALATGRTNTVAVLSGPLNEYYFANTINLLETHLTAHSYDMMLLHTRREARDLLSATKVSMADGVIIIGINLLTEAFLQAKSPSQPCVLIDTTDDFKVDHIVLDFGPAIEEALDLMLHAGKKRLAYVANNVNDSARDEVR
ncbi:LacI family transcriptional regulator, partial [bacterium]